LGAVAASAAWAPRGRSARECATLVLVAGSALVYLASLAIVTAFQPGAEALDTGVGLDVRQQGQALLSVFWSVLGVALLSAGLRGDRSGVRRSGFALLSIAVAKVFLFDMAALESGYRVLSFVVLGLLLLAGAYAYQRVRQTNRAVSSPRPRPS
ncbi:MAG: DUF2339 domain-containing protein, partial [Actinomycetota bacterium]|nr:DUF2339 domain-containing protein [Actinomycetota bacterium]